jgi:hypothetical protein
MEADGLQKFVIVPCNELVQVGPNLRTHSLLKSILIYPIIYVLISQMVPLFFRHSHQNCKFTFNLRNVCYGSCSSYLHCLSCPNSMRRIVQTIPAVRYTIFSCLKSSYLPQHCVLITFTLYRNVKVPKFGDL